MLDVQGAGGSPISDNDRQGRTGGKKSNILPDFLNEWPLNYWVIQKLLLADLTKTQYTRDDNELYSNFNQFPDLLY